MLAWRKWRTGLFTLAVACVVPFLSAELVEFREYHGRQIQCVHSGIRRSSEKTCGTYGYARVFTGTVKSATEVSFTEERLELIPDEVFLGSPAREVTAIVNQACLPLDRPEVKAGDKWLFYLQSHTFPETDEKELELVLPYDSPSKALSIAQEDIAILRHQFRLAEAGILSGRVTRMEEETRVIPVRAWRVTATSSDKSEFNAITDDKGHFEFELAPGSYHLSANTQRGLWAPETQTFVWKRDCTSFDFLAHADGKFSGVVTTPEGKPARHAEVAILQIAPVSESVKVTTDDHGRFEVGAHPGAYIIGVDILDSKMPGEWQLRVYYPGVFTQVQAKPIFLHEGEWQSDINFILPPPPDKQ